MTYTPQQIDFIREYGNKELTEGCLISLKHAGGIVEKYITWEAGAVVKFNYENKISYGIMEEYEILGHPVEWHHVFTKLKEMGWMVSIAIQGNQGYTLSVYGAEGQHFYSCNPCLSPMLQPALMDELLKLKQ